MGRHTAICQIIALNLDTFPRGATSAPGIVFRSVFFSRHKNKKELFNIFIQRKRFLLAVMVSSTDETTPNFATLQVAWTVRAFPLFRLAIDYWPVWLPWLLLRPTQKNRFVTIRHDKTSRSVIFQFQKTRKTCSFFPGKSLKNLGVRAK